jgi:hypothetical protein
MANEQNKDTQNTSFNTDQQSNDFSSTNKNDSTNFGKTESTSSNVYNPDFSGAQNQTSSTTDKSGSAGLSVEAAKETAKGFYDQAKSTVGQAYGAATKRATEVLDEQKGTVADGLTTVADTIKQVGENLNTAEEPNKITETAAKYTNSLAEQIENVSGYFERKDVREMVRDVENFARRYPAYFIGGAVALGFLAARFLKSSSPKQLTRGEGRPFNEEFETDKLLTSGESKPATSQF